MEENKEIKKKRIFKDEITDVWFLLGCIFFVFLIVAIVVFAFWGDYLAFSGMPCGFQSVTHLYCPGCGGTRATYYLLHGRLIKSFFMNPFVLYYAVAYVIFMINTILVKTTNKLGFVKYPVSITVYTGLGLLIVQWIVRNLLLIFFHITCL